MKSAKPCLFHIVLAALTAVATTTTAQTFPDRVVRVIVPWPAGGTTDIAARVVTQHLSTKLGHPVIVENRPGANGMVGADAAAKAAPDGYTLFVASAETHAINPHVYPKLTYDPIRDFVAITTFVRVPFVLAGKTGIPGQSAKDAVGFIRSQPDKLTYGSWGIGSIAQIGMEMIVGEAGLKILHVPFNGGPPAFNALAAGQIDFMILPAGAADPLRKGGKIKILGVTTPTRFSLIEDVPTLKEQGYNVNVANIFGFLAPAKTPQPILQRLEAEITEIVKRADVQSALQAQYTDVFQMPQQEYSRFLASELKRWGDVIKRADIKIKQ
jgi:tripartite-type tricarboxylate transporter receptor subunit TctC